MDIKVDDETKNDFKWLVDDFNLSAIGLYDIDGYEVDGMESRTRGKKKTEGSVCKSQGRIFQKYPRKELEINVTKKMNFYSEVIARCLRENGAVRVRYIYEWISERFPGFKHSDGSWKNKIRYTLTSNPLFKKKKADLGNCNVWSLDEMQSKTLKTHILQSLYPKNFIFPQNKNSKSNSSYQTPFRTKPNSWKESKESFGDSYRYYSASTESFQQNIEMDSHCFTSQGWFPADTGMYDSGAVATPTGPVEVSKIESVEYYELEVPIVTEYLIENTHYQDPIDVKYLLDENTLEII